MSGCSDGQEASHSELADTIVDDITEKMGNNKISPVPAIEPAAAAKPAA